MNRQVIREPYSVSAVIREYSANKTSLGIRRTRDPEVSLVR